MRLTYKVYLMLFVTAFVFTACEQPTDVQQEEPTEPQVGQLETSIPGQYIVVFTDLGKGDKMPATHEINNTIEEVANTHEIKTSAILNRYQHSLQGFTAQLTDAQYDRLKNDPRIDYIERDRIVTFAPPCGTPNGGPCDGDGGGGDSGSEVTPWGITRVGGPVASSGTAWVIDSGIDLDHPDLNVDVNRSRTFVTKGKDSKSADDGNGHGTHVAGTIGALDNDIDVVGVAPGANLVAVKVLDRQGSGSYSNVISGVDYVAANGASGDVANMSLGGPTSQALDDAVRNAADQGIQFVVAAGNDGDDANNYSPARVEYNNVWTVSAIDENDTFASFSNYANPPIEYAAPGVGILSTWKNGGTNTISGTSMASPHVAGLLLVGSITSDGTAINDPDGDADPIASHN